MEQKNQTLDNKEILELIENLGDKDAHQRRTARKDLVAKGDIVIDYLEQLLDHSKHIYRWEAIKTLEELKNPKSIPIFIKSLENDELDIRWIAAEGLIKIGFDSVIPLLEEIIKRTKHSILLYDGAHHVLNNFKRRKKFPKDIEIEELLSALKHHKTTGSINELSNRILTKLQS